MRLNFLPHAKLTSVKSLRFWLLVVLTVLLPLRGALAAALMCPVAGTGVQSEVRLTQQSHEPGHPHEAVHDAAAQHVHADVTTDHHDQSSAGDPVDRCNLCSAFCSVVGMLSEPHSVAEPQDVATIFPQRHAPPSTFFRDGQERPPRTI